MTGREPDQSEKPHGIRSWLSARLVTLSRVYFTWFFLWLILYGLFADRWWVLWLFGEFAQYLFAPLPAVALFACFARRRELLAGSAAALLVWVALWGPLYVPKVAPASAEGGTLTVMTYNMLVFSDQPDKVIETIRASKADVIAFQELNVATVSAIERELNAEYPYRILNPRTGVEGLGVISRFPLAPTGEEIPPQNWTGTPQVLAIDFHGTQALILNMHFIVPMFVRDVETTHILLEDSIRLRERQTRLVADYVKAHPVPLIMLADLNTGDMSTAYRTVTSVLSDAWREAGWGNGHTFPGGDSAGNSRPRIAGIAVPMWLIRIDYVFHSPHWQAESAWLGPWDGVSDHRPVAARLRLRRK